MLEATIKPYDHDEFMVTKGFTIKRDSLNITATVPVGYLTDLASIPRFAWVTTGCPYMPQYVVPSIVHDLLYQTHRDDYRPVTRKEADKIFHLLLRENGVGAYTAWKMYKAVRSFGHFAWRRHKNG